MKTSFCYYYFLFISISDAYVFYSHPRLSTTRIYAAAGGNGDLEKRKSEIQRKIAELKKAGRIPNQVDDSSSSKEVDIESLTGIERLKAQREKLKKKQGVLDEYKTQLQDKLGRKATFIGVEPGKKKQQQQQQQSREARLGSLGDGEGDNTGTPSSTMDSAISIDDEDDLDSEDIIDADEQALVDIVAEKLRVKRALEREAAEERTRIKIEELRLERERQEANAGPMAPRTTGIGGAYLKNETALQETRRPSRGSWGYFERPKDISKAFGGGRRVGAGYMKEVDKDASYESTRQRLKEYRVKMGIEVQSEIDHSQEIDEAVKIAQLAMQRGVYNTAVSALEKVTQWCSSNSKVGSQVFLELAMAYEAVGRTDEATQVYTKLTTCSVQEVKNNAKRLLYGLESYEFMKSDAQLASFSRKKIRSTFIDTTGMDKFLLNFDDVYNTAYIDTSSREYKRLTENVVRSAREARQILLKAIDSGIVERTKIVQALRSVARRFDDAMREERKAAEAASKPVALLDGVPIVAPKRVEEIGNGDFVLGSRDQMLENLNGEWRLQLVADRTGDGVQFYNKTLSWQRVDTENMKFASQGTVGFLTISETGGLEFQGEQRVIRRSDVASSGGGGMLIGLLGPKGGASSNRVPQQVMSVDSILLVTRCAESPRRQDDEKEHFAVWRRVQPGTYFKA